MFEVTLSSSLHAEGILTRALVTLSVVQRKILFIVSAPPNSCYLLTKVQDLAKLKAFDPEDGSFSSDPRTLWCKPQFTALPAVRVLGAHQPFLQGLGGAAPGHLGRRLLTAQERSPFLESRK